MKNTTEQAGKSPLMQKRKRLHQGGLLRQKRAYAHIKYVSSSECRFDSLFTWTNLVRTASKESPYGSDEKQHGNLQVHRP